MCAAGERTEAPQRWMLGRGAGETELKGQRCALALGGSSPSNCLGSDKVIDRAKCRGLGHSCRASGTGRTAVLVRSRHLAVV